jgi:predicted lipase
MSFNRHQAIALARDILSLYANPSAASIYARDTDTQVLVRDDGADRFTIIIPGTDSLVDWSTNRKVRKTKVSHGKVHRGFQIAMLSVIDPIIAALPRGARVTICGHSLGGALATLIAERLAALNWFNLEAVYTFGSPRVGNWSFAAHYNSLLHDITFRIFNARDPVPRVPFVFGTYKHAGTEVYLNDAGGVRIAQPLVTSVIETVKQLREAGTATDSERKFISVSAHNLIQYIGKLEALA